MTAHTIVYIIGMLSIATYYNIPDYRLKHNVQKENTFCTEG